MAQEAEGHAQWLLTPARIGPVEIPNRIVLPPMTTRTATEDGFVTDETMARKSKEAIASAFAAALLEHDQISVSMPTSTT